MQFKVKDLMITVLPEEAELKQLCLLRTKICRYPTKYCICTFLRPTCPAPSVCKCSMLPSWDCVCTNCSPFPTPCQNACTWIVSCHFACSQMPTCPLPCSKVPSYCPGGSIDIDITPQLEDPILIKEVEDIAVLRDELNEVLEQLDELEETGLDVLPETAEDLAKLEGQLREALSAVEAKRGKTKKTK